MLDSTRQNLHKEYLMIVEILKGYKEVKSMMTKLYHKMYIEKYDKLEN